MEKSINNKKTPVSKVGFVLLGFSALCFILAFVVTAVVPYVTESDTIELEATIINVYRRYPSLYVATVEEFEIEIFIAVHLIENMQAIDSIVSGEIINFRILKNEFANINKFTFISPVALRIGEDYVMTLDEHNREIRNAKTTGRVTGSIFGTICLSAAIVCFIKKAKNNSKL